MPEDSKESKAQKLAAARKKLKEYQTKEKRGTDHSMETNGSGQDQLASGATSATLSEKSDSELNLNGHGLESGATTPPVHLASDTSGMETNTSEHAMESFAAPSNSHQPPGDCFNTMIETSAAVTESIATDSFAFAPQTQQNINAIQLLISEKAQLNAELNKYRTSCREKDLENEELRTQFNATTRRLDELQQRYLEQKHAADQLRNLNAEVQHRLMQSEAKTEDQDGHLNELKKQLTNAQTRLLELEQQHKEKCNELELAQIRINQLSDESNITKDNRVESLTQTQFMYEQQIRDLQAMVQQLSQDKEQSNTQYQTYVQHLNAEVTNVNEKNSELLEQCSKLQEREQQLVEHISGLEREIQRNIARQDQLKDIEMKQDVPVDSGSSKGELESEIEKLKEKVSDFDFERHEFQLKIKSQEDRLETYVKDLQQKQHIIEELQDHLQNINSEQPDKTKLLATMESDKIAASRALSQNAELKKQLDELELRFVQLTNDKADLMNKLDAEEYANREMRNTYTQMEEKLHSIDERFKFKDEEMIRLSHENMDLTKKNLMLQQEVDLLKHYEVSEYSERYAKDSENSDSIENNQHFDSNIDNSDNTHAHHVHDHHHNDNHDGHKHEHDHHHHTNDHDHGDGHNHSHSHDEHHSHTHPNACSESDSCQEAKEDNADHQDHVDHSSPPKPQHKTYIRKEISPSMPSSEAVEKLQHRFTQLMAQVADLTEEKQRLEHLVLQLQSETETIGEYIALYQTQRRILKQREYEKAAQMQLLQTEREQMQEKITILNNLVSSLGAELPNNKRIAEHLSSVLAESVSIEPTLEQQETTTPLSPKSQQLTQDEVAINQKLNSNESQEILTKIQSIITEIKENTKEIPTVTNTVDHLNCCSGKFEVV